MKELLSTRVQNLSESATIAMSRKSRELKEQGVDVVNLSLGEPDFNTPGFIKDAAKKAIDENYSKYPPVNGYKDLREAISHKFKRDNGLEYNPEQIVVSTGAKQAIMNVVLALVNPGDEVIVPAPYWVSYHEMVRFAGGTPVVVEATIEDDFKITAGQLKKAITSKTRLVIFSSPCNPTGSAYSAGELSEFAAVLKDNPDLFVVSDEIYEHINFKGKHNSLAANSQVKDQVITVNGVSKAFAMTGWRIGYIGAPQWLASACTKIQGQFTSGASGISQQAAKAAVLADPTVTVEMKKAFMKRRDLIKLLLDDIPGIKANLPAGAFYMFPDVSGLLGRKAGNEVIKTADDLAMYFLTKANVATVSGSAFGSGNNLRISYAASEGELNTALERIKLAVAKLK